MLLHVGGVDPDGLAVAVRRDERNLVEHALHHGLQPPRADILYRRVDGDRDVGERVDRLRGDVERHAFGLHQRDILLDQRRFRLGQDAAHVVAGQRLQLNADRQPALQLRQQVGRLGDVKGAGGDEQNMVGLHRAVLGRYGSAFDQGQEVALNAFARDVAAAAAIAHADLVDLVQKHDAVVLDRIDRFLHQLIAIQQLVGFLVDQELMGILDREAAGLGPAAAHLAEDIADRDRAHLRAGHAGNFKHRHSARRLRFDLDILVVQFSGAQLLAKRIAGRSASVGADQGIEHAIFGGELRAGLHVLALAFPGLRDRNLDEIANDLLDVAADIADLGEFRGLDLDERRAGEFGEPSRDLGLADAGRPDHQDIFRQHFLAQTAGQLQPPPAVAQRDRDGALGVGLADNEAVEFGYDFTGGEVGHGL